MEAGALSAHNAHVCAGVAYTVWAGHWSRGCCKELDAWLLQAWWQAEHAPVRASQRARVGGQNAGG